jgi:hypothetical protein
MSFSHSPKIVTDGLVLALDAGNTKSYVSGSTTWFDKSGNGYIGTLTNGPTFSSANGGSIVFDGANDYISVNNPQTLNPGTGSFSLEVWCKTNQNATFNGLIEARGDNLRGFLFIVDYALPRQITLFMNPNDQASQKTYSATVTPVVTGSWQQVAVTLNRATNSITFYYNGIQAGSTVPLLFTGSVDPGSSYRYLVGGDLGGAEMNGNISISRQYNRTLSAAEITQNFNALRGRFGI